MKSVLFLIPTLDRGGAENVLVELVNRLDQNKFKITVQTLFDKDSQKDRLAPGIEYRSFLYKQFHGNSRLQALVPAGLLYRMIVGRRYDIVVSYLEGPTTHILSGCPHKDTKKVAWVHTGIEKAKQIYVGFTSGDAAIRGYKTFDRIVFVSQTARQRFEDATGHTFPSERVLYNVLDADGIRSSAMEPVDDVSFLETEFNIVSTGKLVSLKGYDRLAEVHNRLVREGYKCHTYILGTGPEKKDLEAWLAKNGLNDSFTLVGFRDNPYKYVSKADLFVCSSRREGFSTAVSEALVLGIPVVSTDCSGTGELLGDNEYGVVTENNEEALYQGIKRLLDDPALLAHYREKASVRGRMFSTEETVKAAEDMFEDVFSERR